MLRFLNDSGKSPDSLYKALWDATESAPDTALAFVLTLTTGVSLTGTVLPQYPGISASGADAQTTSAILSDTRTRETYQTLDGKAYKVTDDQWNFAVEMLADWGAAGSLCEILWGVAEASPDSGISTVMTAASGATFTFTILPDFPTAGGAGNEAQTVSFNFTVVGTPAESFS